jgi:hypothetical protein
MFKPYRRFLAPRTFKQEWERCVELGDASHSTIIYVSEGAYEGFLKWIEARHIPTLSSRTDLTTNGTSSINGIWTHSPPGTLAEDAFIGGRFSKESVLSLYGENFVTSLC